MAKKKLKLATACAKDSKADLVFWLKATGSNITLKVRDKSGSGWWLLQITNTGTLRKFEDVPDNIGLLVDKKGKIRTSSMSADTC